jgi:hypothetical protein
MLLCVHNLTSLVTSAGKARPLLSCDVSADGLTVAAGSDLQGEDAVIIYWCACQIF